MPATEWRCERFAELDRLIALENARDLRTVAHHAISDDTEGVSMPATSTDATQVKWERHKGTIDAVVAEHFNTRPEQRNIASGETDFDGIWKVLVVYWTAVKHTFPEAWGKPANRSRLMHGAGLRAMGRLMDRVMATIDPNSPHALSEARHELQAMVPLCHWTSGRWEELGDLHWDELQNVPRHIRILSSFLVRSYVRHRGGVR